MKIIFYGTREYDHYYFDVLAADPEYGCEIRFLTANLDADTAPLAQGGDAVCAFVNADCSAPVLEKLAQVAADKNAEFITVYTGEGVDDAQAQQASDIFRARCPDAEITALSGGQPVYYYIIAIE